MIKERPREGEGGNLSDTWEEKMPAQGSAAGQYLRVFKEEGKAGAGSEERKPDHTRPC